MKAFPVMLKGLAEDHFNNNKLSKLLFNKACANIHNFFEGPNYHWQNLDKQNNTTLFLISTKNPDKTIYKNVQLLINKLRELQYGLAPALRNNEFLHSKIVTACQGSPACRYAVSEPPDDLGQLINKLRSSIISYKKEQQGTEAFFTDRRYYSRNSSNNQSPSRHSSNRSHLTNGVNRLSSASSFNCSPLY